MHIKSDGHFRPWTIPGLLEQRQLIQRRPPSLTAPGAVDAFRQQTVGRVGGDWG
jgi:hypothetical protein